MPDGRKRKLETTTADKLQIKKTRGRDIAVDITINDNECCMCFGTYDNDVLEEVGLSAFIVHVGGGHTKTALKIVV